MISADRNHVHPFYRWGDVTWYATSRCHGKSGVILLICRRVWSGTPVFSRVRLHKDITKYIWSIMSKMLIHICEIYSEHILNTHVHREKNYSGRYIMRQSYKTYTFMSFIFFVTKTQQWKKKYTQIICGYHKTNKHTKGSRIYICGSCSWNAYAHAQLMIAQL